MQRRNYPTNSISGNEHNGYPKNSLTPELRDLTIKLVFFPGAFGQKAGREQAVSRP